MQKVFNQQVLKQSLPNSIPHKELVRRYQARKLRNYKHLRLNRHSLKCELEEQLRAGRIISKPRKLFCYLMEPSERESLWQQIRDLDEAERPYAQRDTLGELIQLEHQREPFTHYLVFNFPYDFSVSHELGKDRLKRWEARLFRQLYGPRWQKRNPSLSYLVFPETGKATGKLHYNVLMRVPAHMLEGFNQHAQMCWELACQKGNPVSQSIIRDYKYLRKAHSKLSKTEKNAEYNTLIKQFPKERLDRKEKMKTRLLESDAFNLSIQAFEGKCDYYSIKDSILSTNYEGWF